MTLSTLTEQRKRRQLTTRVCIVLTMGAIAFAAWMSAWTILSWLFGPR